MHNVNIESNEFCGPSVMSAILGIGTDEAASRIQNVTGQRTKVKGVFLHDLCTAFRQYGYECKQVIVPGQTVWGCLFSLRSNPGMYVFTVPNHFIAIEVNDEGRAVICDNHSKTPVKMSSSSRLGMKVVAITKVFKKFSEGKQNDNHNIG